jgi:hypothetical protein
LQRSPNRSWMDRLLGIDASKVRVYVKLPYVNSDVG